jgi:hypothetical protein
MYEELLDEEVVHGLKNMDKYKGPKGLLQMILNEVGGKYASGLSLKVTNFEYIFGIKYNV